MLRVARFDAFQALGTWRWLAVPPVFLLGGWLGAGHAEYVMEVLARTQREPNFWDGALILPTNKYALVFPFVFGFLLVTGDLFVRDQQDGTATLTLLRSRSRVGWWAGKVLALAPPALLYSTLAYLFALVGSAILLPVEPGASRAAEIPWGAEVALYPRFEFMPTPLFFVLVVLYTALALWVVGTFVLAASALYPRLAVPLVVALGWVLAGIQLEEPFLYKPGVVNPIYHATYVSNFDAGGGVSVAPWLYAGASLGGTLLIALAAGAWRLRHAEI